MSSGKAVSFGRFEVDGPGVAEFCRSAEMQSLLGGIVHPIGTACNAEAVKNISKLLHMEPGDIEVPPYRAGVRVGRHTAFGYIDAQALGGLNEKVYHTLSQRNH